MSKGETLSLIMNYKTCCVRYFIIIELFYVIPYNVILQRGLLILYLTIPCTAEKLI